jgi:hypothetical protein
MALSVPLEGFRNLQQSAVRPCCCGRNVLEWGWGGVGWGALPLKLENLFVFFPTV